MKTPEQWAIELMREPTIQGSPLQAFANIIRQIEAQVRTEEREKVAGLVEALNAAITRVQLYYDTFGEVSDCSTHADIGDWLTALATHRAMVTEAV